MREKEKKRKKNKMKKKGIDPENREAKECSGALRVDPFVLLLCLRFFFTKISLRREERASERENDNKMVAAVRRL